MTSRRIPSLSDCTFFNFTAVSLPQHRVSKKSRAIRDLNMFLDLSLLLSSFVAVMASQAAVAAAKPPLRCIMYLTGYALYLTSWGDQKQES